MKGDAFKTQVKRLYYSKMPQVVRSLFDEGFRDSSIASGLLVPISAVKYWRELYEKGDFAKISPDILHPEITPFPPDSSFNESVHWGSLPYDIKRVAKTFFEMGLRARVISHYLDTPISTVYFWYGQWRKNQFIVEAPLELDLNLSTVEKYSGTKKHPTYSLEMRALVKQCFDKGLSNKEISRQLGITEPTVSRWLHLYKDGNFYSNKKEKLLQKISGQVFPKGDNLLKQKAAKALFDESASDEEVSKTLRISLLEAQSWCSMYKQGTLAIHPMVDKQMHLDQLKDASGRYTLEVRRAAKDCFDRGYGYKRTAAILGIAVTAVKEWGRLYKKGQF